MRFKHIAMGILSAAAFASPALANWFDAVEFGANHKKLIGSTRSPTPDDLRATGESKLGAGKTYVFDRIGGHWHEVRPTGENKGTVAVKPAGGAAEPAGANAIAPAPAGEP